MGSIGRRLDQMRRGYGCNLGETMCISKLKLESGRLGLVVLFELLAAMPYGVDNGRGVAEGMCPRTWQDQ